MKISFFRRSLPSPFLFLFLFLFIFPSCNSDDSGTPNDNPLPAIPTISYSIVTTHPHDTSFFTEGLEFYQGTLLESTGLEGRSRLIQSDPATGKIMKQIDLAPRYFGEGLTVLNDIAYQLTWQQNEVLRYDIRNFKPLPVLPLNGEGWGLTNNGSELIASNGTSDLFVYEPSTMKLKRVIEVRENGSPVVNLNELEFANGYIYANQWQYPYILKIDPSTGNLVGRLDFTSIVNQVRQSEPQAEFLNGIAYNPETKQFHLTGKNWSKVYVVNLPQ